MKTKKMLIMMLFLCGLLLFVTKANAEECDSSSIAITSMERVGMEGKTEEVGSPTVDGKKIALNLKMFDVGDSITYDMTINNTSDDDYMMDEDAFKTDSKYIEYTLKTNDGNNVVKANDSKKVTLIISYKSEVEDSLFDSENKYDASNGLVLSLNTDGKEKKIDVMVTDNIKNPKTSAYNLKVIILVLITLIVIIALTVMQKKKYGSLVLIISSMLLIPVVYAVCKHDVEIDSKIIIEKEFAIYDKMISIADETDSCIDKYDGPVTEEVGKTVDATKVYINNCSDKRTVILGDYCWQIIRTTETGGVKMIFNGKAVDNKCAIDREEQPMIVENHRMFSVNYNGEKVVGKSFDYDLETKMFTLKDTETISVSSSNLSGILNKYTCNSTDVTCSTIYYNYYSAFNWVQYSGSYTIEDAPYSNIAMVSYNHPNPFYHYGSSAASGYSSNSEGLSNEGYMYNKQYAIKFYQNNKDGLTFSDSFSYDQTSGTYNLTGSKKTITTWTDDYRELGKKHYTCFNKTESCDTISYVYKVDNRVIGYIDMTDGRDIADVFNEVLYADDVNTKDSNAKYFVEKWYEKYMLPYNDKLEDVVYCNDRRIVEYGAFNPQNDIVLDPNYFTPNMLEFYHGTPKSELSCPSLNDQFSISNNKAKLKYPIALATGPEMNLLKDDSLRKTDNGFDYAFLMTPGYLDESFYRISAIYSTGRYSYHKPNADEGSIRPVISIKGNNKIIRGIGTPDDPWIIE